MNATLASKKLDLALTVELSNRRELNRGIVAYDALSSDGSTVYHVKAVDGKAVSCTCPAQTFCLKCKHQEAVELEERFLVAWNAPIETEEEKAEKERRAGAFEAVKEMVKMIEAMHAAEKSGETEQVVEHRIDQDQEQHVEDDIRTQEQAEWNKRKEERRTRKPVPIRQRGTLGSNQGFQFLA